MTVRDTITAKLTAAFAPTALEVIDESHHHHGHGGWREGGETHFRVKMVSAPLPGSRASTATVRSTRCWTRS